jgi:hypothetical protein
MIQVGREDGYDDEAVKSKAAATWLRCRLDLAMAVEWFLSLCVCRMPWVPSHFILGLTRRSHRHKVRSSRIGGLTVPEVVKPYVI